MDKKVVFSIGLVCFWIKGFISVDKHSIKTSVSNTILGIIPLGKDEKQFTLRNVQGSSVSTKFSTKSFLLGIVLIILGFNVHLIWLLFAIIILLTSIMTSITITGNGDSYQIYVPFFEKSKIIAINKSIQDALIYREDKEVNATQASSEAIVNAINNK